MPLTDAIKERPILFSGEMIRALRAGTKTQTRRAVKNNRDPMADVHLCQRVELEYEADGSRWWHFSEEQDTNHEDDVLCPYGQPGDVLWVRETFDAPPGSTNINDVVYRADYAHAEPQHTWRPSIFMPKWACRIRLKLTDVRAERVQSISWSDAIAEGIKDPRRCAKRLDPAHGPVAQYRALWDRINSKTHPWSSNPWCWVLRFEVLPCP